MKHPKPLMKGICLAGCLLAGALYCGESRADVAAETEMYATNWPLLHSGIWTFAGSYVPSVVVSRVSPHEFDRSLAIPVAGPWINLATRDCAGCNLETLNRVLLVGDGVLQTVGVVKIIGALFFWERRVATIAAVDPENLPLGVTALAFDFARVGEGGYGAVAGGRF